MALQGSRRANCFRLGPSMQIDVVHVASIPRAGSGKLRTVLNLLDQQAE